MPHKEHLTTAAGVEVRKINLFIQHVYTQHSWKADLMLDEQTSEFVYFLLLGFPFSHAAG